LQFELKKRGASSTHVLLGKNLSKRMAEKLKRREVIKGNRAFTGEGANKASGKMGSRGREKRPSRGEKEPRKSGASQGDYLADSALIAVVPWN